MQMLSQQPFVFSEPLSRAMILLAALPSANAAGRKIISIKIDTKLEKDKLPVSARLDGHTFSLDVLDGKPFKEQGKAGKQPWHAYNNTRLRDNFPGTIREDLWPAYGSPALEDKYQLQIKRVDKILEKWPLTGEKVSKTLKNYIGKKVIVCALYYRKWKKETSYSTWDKKDTEKWHMAAVGCMKKETLKKQYADFIDYMRDVSWFFLHADCGTEDSPKLTPCIYSEQEARIIFEHRSSGKTTDDKRKDTCSKYSEAVPVGPRGAASPGDIPQLRSMSRSKREKIMKDARDANKLLKERAASVDELPVHKEVGDFISGDSEVSIDEEQSVSMLSQGVEDDHEVIMSSGPIDHGSGNSVIARLDLCESSPEHYPEIPESTPSEGSLSEETMETSDSSNEEATEYGSSFYESTECSEA